MIWFALPQVFQTVGKALLGVSPEVGNAIMNVKLGEYTAAITGFTFAYGAYMTEVFRAGIQAVPKGQTEAAWALGLSGWQAQRRIVLPLAFKIVIPAVGNDFIALIKDTALVSTIAVAEILKQAQLVGGRYYDFLSPLLVAALIYWVLTIFFSFWQSKLERRMEHDRARA